MLNKLKEIKTNKGFHKYFFNTSWLLFEKIFRMIISFFVGIWVARYLGPEQFGLLNYSIAVVTLIGSFVQLGLSGLVVRELVKNPEDKDEILGTTFYLRLIAGIVSCFLSIVLAYFLNTNDDVTVSMISIISLMLILQSFETIDLWFQSKIKSKYIVFAKNFSLVGVSLGKVALILLKAPLIYFALIFLIEFILLAIAFVYVFKKDNQSIRNLKFNLKKAKFLLGKSWPLILSSMAAAIYLKVDQLMLKQMAGDEAVGIFSVAVKLTEVWFFVPIAVVSSFFPTLIMLKKENEKKYNLRLQQIYDFLFLLAISLAIPVSLFSDLAVKILYGKAYSEAGIILTIQIWTAIFVFSRALLSKWLINEGLLIFSLVSHGLGALLNIGLNLILIPKFEGVGASIATLASYSVSTVLFCFLNKKTREAGLMMLRSYLTPFRYVLKKLKI